MFLSKFDCVGIDALVWWLDGWDMAICAVYVAIAVYLYKAVGGQPFKKEYRLLSFLTGIFLLCMMCGYFLDAFSSWHPRAAVLIMAGLKPVQVFLCWLFLRSSAGTTMQAVNNDAEFGRAIYEAVRQNEALLEQSEALERITRSYEALRKDLNNGPI